MIGRLVSFLVYGQNNYSRAGAVDRFAQYEDVLAASAGQDIRAQTYLPTDALPNSAWVGNAANTDTGLAYLDFRDPQNDPRLRAAPPGGEPMYLSDYGLQPGALMIAAPVGYGVALTDPTNDYYGGDLPLATQPQVYEPAPWDAPGLP